MQEHLFSISKTFQGRLFVIPNYQRGYAWERQQCQDFLDDVALIPVNRSHYFGTLVLQKQADNRPILDNRGRRYERYDVIDGQQRLTTIVIFLQTIHNAMSSDLSLAPLCTELRQSYLAIQDRLGQPIATLTLNQSSQHFFKGAILNIEAYTSAPNIQAQRRLMEAKQLFEDYLQRKSAELGQAYGEWLETTYLKVIHQMRWLVYNVDDDAEAGVIFETMNNRGKVLTELEKVKNYLLYLASRLTLDAPHQLAEQVNRTWQHIYESLMRCNLGTGQHEDRLLRTTWLMAQDKDRTNWDGSRTVKLEFDLREQPDHVQLFHDLTAYLDMLHAATTAYCDIVSPIRFDAFGKFAGEQSALQKTAARLRRLGASATFLPLLIASHLRYNGEQLLQMVTLCEKFSFRVYRWRNRRSNTGQSRLISQGYEVFHGRAFDHAENELRRAVHNYCTDQQFMNRFDDRDVNWYRWAGLKYFLYEYEQHEADRQRLPVNMPWEELAKKKDSIEHILPQTPDDSGYWQARFDDVSRYVHDIGNLTLTYHNSELGRLPFIREDGDRSKKDIYAKSQLFIEKALAEEEDWTPAQLESRRATIAAWAANHWHVEPPAPSSDTVVAEPNGRKQTVAKVQALAEARGVGDLYDQLLEAVKSHGLGLRPFKKCVTFTPPQGRQFAVGAAWPKDGHIAVGLWLERVSKHFGVDMDDVKEHLNDHTWQSVDRNNIDEWIADLDTFFAFMAGDK